MIDNIMKRMKPRQEHYIGYKSWCYCSDKAKLIDCDCFCFQYFMTAWNPNKTFIPILTEMHNIRVKLLPGSPLWDILSWTQFKPLHLSFSQPCETEDWGGEYSTSLCPIWAISQGHFNSQNITVESTFWLIFQAFVSCDILLINKVVILFRNWNVPLLTNTL